jgi:hypothetical protein
MIGVQWESLGDYLLYQLGLLAADLPLPQNWMVPGLVVIISVRDLVNSLLLNTSEGYWFAYLIGALFGSLNYYPKAIFWERRSH